MKDFRQIDALYQPVPTFDKWKQATVETARWERYRSKLQAYQGQSQEMFDRANKIVTRATAIDTGALEGLYEVDRGFTMTVAMEAATWEAKLNEKGDRARALIESQLRGYDYVLDFATETVPIAEAWIRKLHEELCAGQDTYQVMTEAGWQNQRLPLGEYKHHPNHVERSDGAFHPYAPVDQTPPEMRRFCEELRSDSFGSAHPILQAAYSHYGFVWIHPFADGNGRVARALASVYTYRAASIPLVVLADKRKEYLDSLSAADGGNPQPFVDLVLERAIDAIELVGDSFAAAAAPSYEEALSELKSLYMTKGGYTHHEVNEAGIKLLNAFQAELHELVTKNVDEQWFKGSAGRGNMGYQPVGSNMRTTGPGVAEIAGLNLSSSHPAEAQVSKHFALELPEDCDTDDAVALRDNEGPSDVLEMRMSDLVPDLSVNARFRMRMFAEQVFGKAIKDLVDLAKAKLESKG